MACTHFGFNCLRMRRNFGPERKDAAAATKSLVWSLDLVAKGACNLALGNLVTRAFCMRKNGSELSSATNDEINSAASFVSASDFTASVVISVAAVVSVVSVVSAASVVLSSVDFSLVISDVSSDFIVVTYFSVVDVITSEVVFIVSVVVSWLIVVDVVVIVVIGVVPILHKWQREHSLERWEKMQNYYDLIWNDSVIHDRLDHWSNPPYIPRVSIPCRYLYY
ncbi:hypothetical protein FF38_12438 [Lucilia cuprina]|uniref:Transmembrane protein n=1 Tax=Lucilia cuprina TaxID=7375 RepID=A0A0L0CHV2_LUCCU|nr:hypothetical protein FF38_12438 [Lucilia cuprina]